MSKNARQARFLHLLLQVMTGSGSLLVSNELSCLSNEIATYEIATFHENGNEVMRTRSDECKNILETSRSFQISTDTYTFAAWLQVVSFATARAGVTQRSPSPRGGRVGTGSVARLRPEGD